MSRAVVDETILAEIVRRLVEAVDPDRIILFGSRARGEERPDSDVDLMIVKASDDSSHRRVIPAYQALGGLGVSKDVVWYTPEEVNDWAGVRNHIISRALREGRVLYEKRP